MNTKPISELSFEECCEALNLKPESVEYPLSLQELAEVDRLVLDRLNVLLAEQKAKYESCTTIAELNAFAKRHPNTSYAAKAKQRVEKLKKRNRIFGLSALGMVLIVVLSIVLNNVIAEQNRRKQERIEQEERERFYAATHGKTDYHDWVDLGLSVKWATCNVGASSPEEYGDYFAWGEIEPKSSYSEENCKTFGLNISSIAGCYGYDAARANWSPAWRLPTKTEMQELCSKCVWTWTNIGGHNGCLVIGPNGNSIFLPAAGCRFTSQWRSCEWPPDGENLYGDYWTATPCYDSRFPSAYYLSLSANSHNFAIGLRRTGSSVRPVCD